MKAGFPPTSRVQPPDGGRGPTEPPKDLRKVLFEPIPGLLLALAVSAGAIRLAEVPYVRETLHLGALLLVILLGMLWKNVLPPPDWALPGIAVAQRSLLRWGVALLGFKLSLGKLVSLGGPSLVVVVVSTLAAIAFGIWFGKAMGLNDRLAVLLSVGGGVCGASAIIATETVVRGEQKDVAASIGVITLLGTIGILLYPLLGNVLDLSPFLYGVWAGASLHETAQVVAAAQALHAEDVATVVKLARIALLAPIVFYFAWWIRKSGKHAEAKVAIVPWFLVLFVLFALANSWLPIPRPMVDWINETGNLWILCIGMAGVGLQTGFRDLRQAGVAAIMVGAVQWLFLAVLAFALAAVLVRQPKPQLETPSRGNVIIPRPQ